MSIEWLFLGVRLAMALALYGFLSAILMYLWRDFRLAEERVSAHPQAYLNCVSGAHEGEVFLLSLYTEVGRAADNTIWLDEPTVSAYHARLSFTGGQWWVEDLGSRNGTMLNDIRVEQPVVVTYEDHISFGKVLMILNASAGIPSGSAVTSPAETVLGENSH